MRYFPLRLVSVLTSEQEICQSRKRLPEQGESAPLQRDPAASGLVPTIGWKVLLMAVAVGLVGLIVLVPGIDTPRTFNYDELYYVPAANGVLAGSLNMDPGEPPLGKMMMAVGIKAAGNNPFGWRISGAVCGALTLVAVFLWTYVLFGEYQISMLAAALTLLNNFLFVMCRVAMMDIFLVFFLFWAILAFTAALQLELRATMRRLLLGASGFLLGLAGACKWNAVDTLLVFLTAGLALPWLTKLWRLPVDSALARFTRNLQQVGTPSLLFSYILFPALSYFSAYWLLFRCVGLPFGIRAFLNMNYALWHFHRTDGVALTSFQHWYQWPFAASPVRALSYLLGNPVVMWGGLASIFFCLWRCWKSLAVAEVFVAALYAANLLQWAVTPARGAYYYYYFPSAMILGVALAVTLRRLPRNIFGIRLSLLVVVAAALVFAWCYPRMAHLDAPWDCVFGCWN